ncbi:hypothetical protein BU17DRAFT_91163 [Hysterangium stoloniferum]|nr:hypothetical protein BU17DRAFT_91163 [Hysterangium stoloniferum]
MDDGAAIPSTSGAMRATPPMPNSPLHAATALRSAASDSKGAGSGGRSERVSQTPPSAPFCAPESPGTAVLVQHGQHPTGSPAHPSCSSHASRVRDMAAPVGCPSGGRASAIDGCAHWHNATTLRSAASDSKGAGDGFMLSHPPSFIFQSERVSQTQPSVLQPQSQPQSQSSQTAVSPLCSQHTAPLTFEALRRLTPPSAPFCAPASPRTTVLVQRGQHPTGSPAHPSRSSHASRLTNGSGSGAESEDDGGGGGVVHMEVDVGGMELQIQDAWAVLSSPMRTPTQNRVQKASLYAATSSPKPGRLHLQPNPPGSPLTLNILNLTSSCSPEVMFAGTGSGCGADDAMANTGQGSDMSISQGDPSSDSGFAYEDGGVGGGQSCKHR